MPFDPLLLRPASLIVECLKSVGPGAGAPGETKARLADDEGRPAETCFVGTALDSIVLAVEIQRRGGRPRDPDLSPLKLILDIQPGQPTLG